MAWFHYKCPIDGDFKLSLPKRIKKGLCPKCGQMCDAVISLGTMRVVERLDNGAMARAVERLHNVEELLDERCGSAPEGQEDVDSEQTDD